MILKVMYGQNTGGNWAYFDAEKFYHIQVKTVDVGLDVEWILLPQTDIQKEENITLVIYYHNGLRHEVATNRVVWILNNEGKTIDRIN